MNLSLFFLALIICRRNLFFFFKLMIWFVDFRLAFEMFVCILKYGWKMFQHMLFLIVLYYFFFFLNVDQIEIFGNLKNLFNFFPHKFPLYEIILFETCWRININTSFDWHSTFDLTYCRSSNPSTKLKQKLIKHVQFY